jgi:hypothetical protein
MGRLLLAAVAAIAIFFLLRTLLAKRKLSVGQFFALYAAALAVVVLIGLGLTGRLHPVTASLGVVLAMLVRALPVLMRLFQAVNLWKTIKAALGVASVQKGPKTGSKSQIESAFLTMTLDHDSGELDGTIKKGAFQGQRLSQLSRDALLALQAEVASDIDSSELLQTFFERYHGDHASSADAAQGPSGDMNRAEAITLLELGPDPTNDEIIKAHRRLMQIHHPDRGGSNDLAARLNAAKDKLLGEH